MECIKYICIYAFLVFLLFFYSCTKSGTENPKGTVEYKVECDKSNFMVTYISEGVGQQKEIKTNSWSHSYSAYKGDLVHLEAISYKQNATINGTIIWKGKSFKNEKKTGDFPWIQINGSLN